jgi:ankyrin repeat protein
MHIPPTGFNSIYHSALRGLAAVILSMLISGNCVLSQDLMEAVRQGDSVKVKEFIKNNQDLVLMRDSSGYTPLHWASIKGNYNIARLLIRNKADINARDKNNCTALFYAASRDYEDIVNLLLEKNADINAGGSIEERVSKADVKFKSQGLQVANIIVIKNGAENAIVGRRENGDYFKATVQGWNMLSTTDLNDIYLRDARTDLNDKIEHPLIWYINMESLNGKDYISNYQSLLKNSAAALFGDAYKCRIITLSYPLIPNKEFVAENDQYDPMKMAKANLRYQQISKLSPADRSDGYMRIANGLSPLGEAEKEESADKKELIAAVKKGNLEKIKALFKGMPNLVYSRDYNGNTPLHWAAIFGQREIAEFLLVNKADINAVENLDGNTPLHYAVYYNRLEVVKYLLENKADVNFVNSAGWTALHVVAFGTDTMLTKKEEMIKLQPLITRLLFSFHANPFLETKNKVSALGLALLKGNFAAAHSIAIGQNYEILSLVSDRLVTDKDLQELYHCGESPGLGMSLSETGHIYCNDL